MYTLAFDTTATSCSIALFEEEKCLETFIKEMEFGQAEVLIPEIGNMLQKHKASVSDLNLLAVCVGPGSFTGVRSSISAARAFGLACPKMEVMGVSAFDAYIQALVSQPDAIASANAVIIETKREDFYYQIFDEHLRAKTPANAGSREDIVTLLRNKKVSFLGDGVERFLSVKTGLSIHAILQNSHIDIKELALCAIRKYLKKEHNYPKPLYLRAPDVCVKS